jgi:DNA-directed RNA polymerase subunit RPC12/RpoP
MTSTNGSDLRCPYCGRPEVNYSRRRWWDRLFSSLSVYRCGSCARRFRRPVQVGPPARGSGG